MLHWTISLVAVPAVLFLLAMSETCRRCVEIVARALYHAANWICAWVSAGFDLVLRPSKRDGSASLSRLALWILTNAAAIAASYHLRATHQDTAALVTAGLLFALHVTVTTASILVIAEENRIMHLGQPRSGAGFNPQAAVRSLSIILLETLLTLASAAVLLDMVSRALPGEILTSTPNTGLSFADHLLCLLAALPGFGALVGTTEFAGEIRFGGGLGTLAHGSIYVMGSTLIYGATATWVYQRSATAMLLARLGEANGDDAHFLQLILSRAPHHIKADLLALAIDSAKPQAQIRAINVMRHLKVWTFPQTFLHHLSRFERKVQVAGLNQIREFLADEGLAFEPDLVLSGTRKAFDQYVALAPSIENTEEDAVLNRLGAVVADYMSLLEARNIGLKTTSQQYRVMLDVAMAHRDDKVRRLMAQVLMARSPKGFLLSYLVVLHKLNLGAVDLEIIEGFGAYLSANQRALSGEDRDIVARRLNWNIWHAGLSPHVTQALKDVQQSLRIAESEGSDQKRPSPTEVNVDQAAPRLNGVTSVATR